jgi:hypothetical protein
MNLGEMLRAKLMMTQYTEATTPKVEEAPKIAPVPEPEKRKPFQISNNLNRVLFEQAQSYPTTRKALVSRMAAMGFKPGSVNTIIGQMLRQGLMQPDNEGVLHLTVAEYTPLKSSRTMRRRELAKGKDAAKPKHKQIKINVRNRTVEEVREERPVSSFEGMQETRVKSILRSLSILEALELYAELRKVFGDNK